MKFVGKTALRGSTSLCSIAILAGFAAASPAAAQDTPVTDTSVACDDANANGTCDADEVGETGSIVVTGSRIQRPNLESTVPVSSISGETFFKQGDPNVGETLNELPQLRSTFSQQNPGLGIGIAGLNLLDLRGLGTARTLVLVNGRRHVAADILNNAVSPDINSIPNDLIERVDVVTGGNSAVYGSDAIAGVVNFVLRRSYEGIQLRGSAGVSPEGFGGNQYVSGMIGQNFGDGAGNITLHAEYANQERVFGSQIPWLRQVDQFAVVDVDPAGLPNASDGFPDAILQRDVRTAAINRFGLIPITQPGGAGALCGVGAGPTNGAPSTTSGLPYNCTYLFDSNSNFFPQTGSRYGPGIIGGIVGGNGQTGREGQLLSIQPQVERYNFNALAHYEFSPAFELFGEAKWTRVDAVGNNASPTGIQGTLTQFDFRERIRLDNPFLTSAQRTQIANLILASGCNTSLTANCVTATGAPAGRSAVQGQGVGGPLNAADIAAINAGTYRTVVARNLLDLGIRDEVFRRDTYRFVGGLRGTFNTDWNYEISANYGRFDQTVDTNGFLDRQRFALALDAGRNPVTGQIQCRSQFDPAAAVAYDTGVFQAGADPAGGAPGSGTRSNPAQRARLAADIAACVPYNPFGGADNTASANYFRRSAHTDASLEQFVVSGFVGGDTSGFFELPGGPIRFAVGAEYRREDGTYFDDPFLLEGNPGTIPSTQNNTNAVVIGNFDPPAFEVKEAFAEIQIPIISDTPFFEELTISGAARVSDYANAAAATGTVWSYNAGIDYAPVEDLRFRANYSRAVRAPNLSELYFPAVANFAPGFLDPCSSTQIGNNPNRAANCLASVGGDASKLASIRTAALSLPVITGSNPNLTAETADSYTVGAVFQPRFIPGLAVSVDYYDITVNNVIVTLGAQAIANNCVDQTTIDNPFCGLFERNLTNANGPGQEPPGEILGGTLIQGGVNFAARKRRGLDVNVAYRANLSDAVRLNTNLIYTHNFQISDFQNPTFPDFENRILSEVGDPQDEFRWDVDLSYDAFTFGYKMRYIGPQYVGAFESFRALPTACAATSCTPAQLPPLNLDQFSIQKTPAVFYHDIRGEWNLADDRFQFYVGVDNLLNTIPPFGLSGTGSIANGDRGGGTAAIFDAFGRKVYAGVRARF